MRAKTTVRVLVIEDDADVREGIVQTLTEEHFNVDAADNGADGLYYAQNWDYDVIVLDVMLPQMDGWQVLTSLRKEKATPVLMLTARGDLDDRVTGLNAGADDYLVKPYHERELLARIRALTRRGSKLVSAITLGRVTVDTESQTVMLDNDEIKLTAAQYRLLEYLARRAGKVVTRSELADAVGIDDDSISNVIDVQVHHIRRKLGKEFVQSRRGLGFIIPVK